MDAIEQAGSFFGLVRLKLADQVKRHVGCFGAQLGPFGRGLLHAILAEVALSGSDQRRAVSFFKDPEKAHKVWMSKSRGDDAFWDRYKAFGAQAEAMCGSGG